MRRYIPKESNTPSVTSTPTMTFEKPSSQTLSPQLLKQEPQSLPIFPMLDSISQTVDKNPISPQIYPIKPQITEENKGVFGLMDGQFRGGMGLTPQMGSQEDLIQKIQMMQNYQLYFNSFLQTYNQLQEQMTGKFMMNQGPYLCDNKEKVETSFNNMYNCQQQSPEQKGFRKKKRGALKNNNREETKNLLKIYSLGFHKYIENTYKEMFGIPKEEIMKYLDNNRLKSYTLKGLRQMWEHSSKLSPEIQKYNKIIRIYCRAFLQSEAISYFLTHSRTKNPYIILKYRVILLKHIHQPEELTFLKRRDKDSVEDDKILEDMELGKSLSLKKQRSSQTQKLSLSNNSMGKSLTMGQQNKFVLQQTPSQNSDTEKI